MSFKNLLGMLCAMLFAFSFSGGSTLANSGNEVSVQMNMARILRLPADAATVIIGMPGIADAVIQDPRTLVLTGKGFGTTNLIALDNVGNPIADLLVHVSADNDNQVTVFQGVAKTTVSCTPTCQPMVSGGDDPQFANQVAQSLATVQALSGSSGF